jgi:geranylgeranyl reductase family protein
MTHHYTHDILILGAGPAGTTAALALRDAGLKVALIDKAAFPRDKVCGDAIPGRAVRVLRELSPAYAQAFDAFPAQCFTSHSAFYVNNHAPIELQWVNQAYTCARLDFDNWLLQLVQQETNTDCFLQTSGTLTRTPDAITFTAAHSALTLRAPVMLGCDGANSLVRKQFTDFKMDLRHYGGAVRAYYENVAGLESYKTEIYVLKKYLPGYCWVFPLPDNRANVGFGMLSQHISNKRLNLKTIFYDFLQEQPLLREKFAGSTQIGSLQGFGLPFGSKKIQVSGERFLLCGDAASMIDPASGDGIGNAMWSGALAAEQAKACFTQQRFDAAFLKTYEVQLYQKLWKELRRRAFLQQIATQLPALLEIAALAARQPIIKRLLHQLV